MARVTVEDCVERVPNRFDLTVLAAHRARALAAGAELCVPRERDKDPVVALREIAEGAVSVESIRGHILTEYTQNKMRVDSQIKEKALGEEVPSESMTEEEMLRALARLQSGGEDITL